MGCRTEVRSVHIKYLPPFLDLEERINQRFFAEVTQLLHCQYHTKLLKHIPSNPEPYKLINFIKIGPVPSTLAVGGGTIQQKLRHIAQLCQLLDFPIGARLMQMCFWYNTITSTMQFCCNIRWE